MKFSPKCRVLCLQLTEGRGQLKKGRGVAGEGKRGSPSLYVGLAGALICRGILFGSSPKVTVQLKRQLK